MKIEKVQIDLKREWLELHEGDKSLYLKSSKRDKEYLLTLNYGEKLLNTLIKSTSTDEIVKELGSEKYSDLTLIYIQNGCCFLKSDIVRTHPLYYVKNGKGYLIKDQISIRENYGVDEESIEEFIATGYVSGSNTIYSGVSGVQAAEIIAIKNELKQHRFFFNKTDEDIELYGQFDLKKRAKILDKLFISVFSEMIHSIPDNAKIIVPLSGWHDSRLIVNYLYRLGFRNVICYSYGTVGNKQSKISRQVAEALGYDWYFVEYTENKWKELHDNGQIEKYFDFSFGGVSTPHLQDFLAVYELKSREICKPNDVFVPGHGLDILCHIIDTEKYDEEIEIETLKRTVWKKISYKNKNSAVYKRFKVLRDEFPFEDKYFPDHVFWQERQSKFIVNSLRVYEHFGFQHRIPFWDRKIVNFWLSVPLKLKYTRELLFVMEGYTLNCQKLKQVPYSKPRTINKANKTVKKRIVNLKNLVPDSLKIAILRFTKRKTIQSVALNLIYSLEIKVLSDLVKNLNRWPKGARKYFIKDMRRMPYQLNHELLIRIHTVEEIMKNKK